MTATKPTTRFGSLTITGESIALNIVVPYPPAPPGHPEIQGIELHGARREFKWDDFADAVEAWRDLGVEECTLVAFAVYADNVTKQSEFKPTTDGGAWTEWRVK